jgi:hypothetical protein
MLAVIFYHTEVGSELKNFHPAIEAMIRGVHESRRDFIGRGRRAMTRSRLKLRENFLPVTDCAQDRLAGNVSSGVP